MVAIFSAGAALGPFDIVTAIAEVVKFFWGYAFVVVVVDVDYEESCTVSDSDGADPLEAMALA